MLKWTELNEARALDQRELRNEKMTAKWVAVAVALSLSMVACGGGVSACKKICKKAAKCDESDEAYQKKGACERDCEDAAELAKKAECKSEYNDAVKCAKENFACDGGSGEDCQDEGEALRDCTDE